MKKTINTKIERGYCKKCSAVVNFEISEDGSKRRCLECAKTKTHLKED